jgi:gamma-glutamyltranspeptidase
VPESTLMELRRRGHEIEVVGEMQPGWGPASIIRVDGPVLETARDPRVDTTSAVVL